MRIELRVSEAVGFNVENKRPQRRKRPPHFSSSSPFISLRALSLVCVTWTFILVGHLTSLSCQIPEKQDDSHQRHLLMKRVLNVLLHSTRALSQKQTRLCDEDLTRQCTQYPQAPLSLDNPDLAGLQKKPHILTIQKWQEVTIKVSSFSSYLVNRA